MLLDFVRSPSDDRTRAVGTIWHPGFYLDQNSDMQFWPLLSGLLEKKYKKSCLRSANASAAGHPGTQATQLSFGEIQWANVQGVLGYIKGSMCVNSYWRLEFEELQVADLEL